MDCSNYTPLCRQRLILKLLFYSVQKRSSVGGLGGDRQWKMAVPRDERVLNSSFSKAFRHGRWKQKKAMRGGNLESRQGTAKRFNLLVYWAYVFLWHPGLWGKRVIMKEFCFMHPSVRACLLVGTVHPSEYRLNCVTWHCCSLLPYPYGLCQTAPWV